MSFRPSSFLSVAGACALLSLASSARADAPAPIAPVPAAPAAPAPSAASGTDLVRLRDGSMIRGTISELTVGGDVVVLTLTGETRRVPMSDVEYAGPASGAGEAGAPSAPNATPAAAAKAERDGDAIPIKVVSNEKDVTLAVRNGTSSGVVFGGYGVASLTIEQYQSLCVAPCRTTLPKGAHTLGASLPGHRVITVETPVRIEGPATLNVTYTSKKDTRTGAFVVMGIGYAAAIMIPLAVIASHEECDIHASNFRDCVDNDSTRSTAMAGALVGIAIGTVGLIVALVSKDTVSFALTPYAAPAQTGAGAGAGSADKASSPRASLRLTRSGVGIAF